MKNGARKLEEHRLFFCSLKTGGIKMMTYEIFKVTVMEKLIDFIPEEYKKLRITLVPEQPRVNQIRDCISITISEDDSNMYGLIFYMDNLYSQYEESRDLQEVLENTGKSIMDTINSKVDVSKLLDYDKARENIVIELINTEQNKELLENSPHREFLDLSIVYRWLISTEHSALVNNDLAAQLGIDECALYEAAVENTKRILPPTVQDIRDTLVGKLIETGSLEETVEMLNGPEYGFMYVISNSHRFRGAVGMLYDEVLQALAQKFNSDLYIMPSSIEEVMAVAAFDDPYELAKVVNEINMTSLYLKERLSNQVYHYDKVLRKLSLATDTPNKRLDGAG